MVERTDHTHARQVVIASGLNILAAIWLFISALTVMRPVAAIAWSNGIAAIVIFVLAAFRTGGAYGRLWLSWLNLVFGVWIFVSTWVITGATSVPRALTNNIVTGAVIAILAFWSAMASATERSAAGIAAERPERKEGAGR
jgi:uncharacterized membrane protein